jgi:hypothetical protein
MGELPSYRSWLVAALEHDADLATHPRPRRELL